MMTKLKMMSDLKLITVVTVFLFDGRAQRVTRT